MIKKIKTGLTAFFGVCLITSMLSSCGAGRTVRPPEQPNAQRQGQNMQPQGLERGNLPDTAPQPGKGGMLGVNPGDNQGSTQPGQQMAQDRQKAENIKNQLRNMKEIADANVIVMGNNALVGYKPAGNAGDTNTAKNMITNRVKEIDRTITNVLISEQPDIMNRMKRLGDDITNNKPVENITNEFNQMIRGINPATH